MLFKMIKKKGMIEITSAHFMGEGHQRICYSHPDQDDVCIKVLKPRRSALRQQNQELQQLKKLPKGYGKNGLIVPFLGMEETTQGPGYLFPVVKNNDGSRALNLSEYLQSPSCDFKSLAQQFDTLKRFLLAHCIIFRDVNASNILCPVDAEGTVRIVVIDGLGDRVDFPLSLLDSVPFLARRKIFRRWDKFMNPILKCSTELSREMRTS